MRTLYISDLDGTLLRSSERTSEFTNGVINSLTAKGMLFSYATARSAVTASKVTNGLVSKIPLITYNGAAVVENACDELKAAATGVIGSNEDDGVAKWLLENYK